MGVPVRFSVNEHIILLCECKKILIVDYMLENINCGLYVGIINCGLYVGKY